MLAIFSAKVKWIWTPNLFILQRLKTELEVRIEPLAGHRKQQDTPGKKGHFLHGMRYFESCNNQPSCMASLLNPRQGVRLGVTPRGYFWGRLYYLSLNSNTLKYSVKHLKVIRGGNSSHIEATKLWPCACQAHRQPCQHGLQESKWERKWARPSVEGKKQNQHVFPSCFLMFGVQWSISGQVSGKCNLVLSLFCFLPLLLPVCLKSGISFSIAFHFLFSPLGCFPEWPFKPHPIESM